MTFNSDLPELEAERSRLERMVARAGSQEPSARPSQAELAAVDLISKRVGLHLGLVTMAGRQHVQWKRTNE